LNLNYRAGGEADLKSVYALNCEAFPESWSQQGLSDALQACYQFLVCMDGDILAGYLLSQDVLDEVHIMQIAVSPDYRRQGIAEQLSQNLLEANKGSEFLLEVRASNQAAQSLYAKLGFTHSGIRKAYYVPQHQGAAREDAVLMQYLSTAA